MAPSGPETSRSWCWTLNNWTNDDIIFLETVQCTYLCYGKEIGAETATPHLQGYVQLKNGKNLRNMRATFGPRYHFEARKGTIKQAIDYCKKDGVFTERGKITIRDAKDCQWADVIKLAESGDLDTIKEEYPRLFLTHFKTLMSIRAFNNVPIDGSLEHEWWYGPTGTGKSRKAWADYPDHYSKSVNKWWDGYYGQDVVVIEEWEPKNEMTAAKLKIWADRYPFPAEIKGGTLQKVRPTKIIVTSNYTIDECFPNKQDSDPLKRRFKTVHFPGNLFEIPVPEPAFVFPEDINNFMYEL
nr:MAG: replication associated protein [Cressdnaviricota sp.]